MTRLGAQLTTLQQDFERYKASVSGSVAGFEPETVLVIEIAGSVNEFRQAVEAIGLEWMGEWDIDDIPPDEDFFESNTKGERTNKAVKGRMFLAGQRSRNAGASLAVGEVAGQQNAAKRQNQMARCVQPDRTNPPLGN